MTYLVGTQDNSIVHLWGIVRTDSNCMINIMGILSLSD
jgi:hypothetical protein